ncbi:MAG: seg [Candidatus Taylorbacteria bacterium]|nr:seg [Candidatus Taylorbacteria bacterium]
MLVTFIFLVISLGVIGAAITLIFSKGTIVIKPKTISVAVSTSQIAKLNAVPPQLAYEVISASEEARTDVPAVQTSAVEKKAVGLITLYNNFSNTPQKIVSGTRVSNAKDLIYRTTYDVIIPAQKIVAGKAVPGSVNVHIAAEKPGPDYNSSLTDLTGDFKVVAFQNTPKYTKIFARMKTDITGGYSGKQVVPDKNAQAAAEKALAGKLNAKLIANAKNLIPKGYVAYDGAYAIRYIPLSPAAQGTSSASVGVRAVYTGYVFKADDLVRSFAKDQLAQFPPEGYAFAGLDTLAFKQASTSAAQASSTIAFSLKGNIKIVGTIPVDKLKKELAGKQVQDTGSIIKRYGTVGGAYAKIFPVWMRSLPDDPDRINVEIQSE